MATRKQINLRETVTHQSDAIQVDAPVGMVRGIKILGLSSINNRRYTHEAISRAAPKYEGAKVNIDHPGEGSGWQGRDFADRFGRIINVRATEQGLFGDLRYNVAHEQAQSFAWWAKNEPGCVGFSHNALGELVELADGSTVVEDIIEVFSVDLVGDPASTKGIFESQQRSNMDPLNPISGDTKPEKTESYEEQLGKLVQSIVNDASLSIDEKKKKVLATLKLLDDGGTPPPKPTEEETDPKEEEMEENIKRSKDPLVKHLLAKLDAFQVRESLDLRRKECREQCVASGLSPHAITDVFVESLLSSKDAPSRQALIEDRRRVLGGISTKQPTSAGPVVTEPSLDDFCKALNAI